MLCHVLMRWSIFPPESYNQKSFAISRQDGVSECYYASISQPIHIASASTMVCSFFCCFFRVWTTVAIDHPYQVQGRQLSLRPPARGFHICSPGKGMSPPHSLPFLSSVLFSFCPLPRRLIQLLSPSPTSPEETSSSLLTSQAGRWPTSASSMLLFFLSLCPVHISLPDTAIWCL